MLCKLGSLMVSRPTTVCISHAEALQQAHDLAIQWLHPTDASVEILDNSSSKSAFNFSIQRPRSLLCVLYSSAQLQCIAVATF